MKRTRAPLVALTIAQFLLGIAIAGESSAYDPDRDWPVTAAASGEVILDGNPLADGDLVFDLRASYRLRSGRLGFESTFGYAEPSAELLQDRGGDLELLVFDFSFVWFVNYERQKDYWKGRSRIKPEVILFAGPGWASLRAEDYFDDRRFSTGSEDFFTLNAGLGVNLYWFSDDPERRTSHWHLRPEIRGRWFGSGEDSLDWGVGLLLGYGFGNRPSCGALELQVEETLKFLPQLTKKRLTGAAASYKTAAEHRDDLVDLRARLALHGPRCRQLRDRVEETVRQLNRELTSLRAFAAESGD